MMSERTPEESGPFDDSAIYAAVPVTDATDGLNSILEMKRNGQRFRTVVVLDSRQLLYTAMVTPPLIIGILAGLSDTQLLAIGAVCALGSVAPNKLLSALQRIGHTS